MRDKKLKITKNHIDLNGHVSESCYYSLGCDAALQIFVDCELDKLFLKHQIGLVTFATQLEFKLEVFEGQEITITVQLKAKTKNFRKWKRFITIINEEEEVCCKIFSEGAFFDLANRKVTNPPQAITLALVGAHLAVVE